MGGASRSGITEKLLPAEPSLPPSFEIEARWVVLALDWLELTVLDGFPQDLEPGEAYEVGPYTLVRDPGRTRTHDCRGSIYYTGHMDAHPLAVVTWGASSSVLSKSQPATLKVHNSQLYAHYGRPEQLRHFIGRISKAFRCPVQKISRLDIAGDGANLADFLTDQVLNDTHHWCGAIKWDNSSYNSKTRRFEHFRTKAKSRTPMAGSFYNKTAELDAHEGTRKAKPYIRKHLESAGLLTGSGECYRLEARFTAAYFRNHGYDGGLEDLPITPAELATMYSDFLTSAFKFKARDASRRDRCSEMRLIEISNVDALAPAPVYVPRPPDERRSDRVTTKKLLFDYVLDGSTDHDQLRIAARYIKRHRDWSWVEMKKAYWGRDLVCKARTRGVVADEYDLSEALDELYVLVHDVKGIVAVWANPYEAPDPSETEGNGSEGLPPDLFRDCGSPQP